MTNKILNIKLYNKIKKLADKKFSKSSAYKSAWIVKQYKKAGGKYSGSNSLKKRSSLSRWFEEKWIDLNRPIKNSKGKIIGYKECGRKYIKSREKYPLCRPSKKINKYTPRTIKEISKKSIKLAKQKKSKVKGSKNIMFGKGITNYMKKLDKYLTQDNIDKSIKYLDKLNNVYKEMQIGSGNKFSQYYGKKSKIMVKVPTTVKNQALKAYQLKKDGFKGMIETGWKRAKQLSTQSEISINDIRFMRNWYARHYYTSRPSYIKWIKAKKPKTSEWFNKKGILAWIGWGGEAALKWMNSNKIINLLNREYNKNYKKIGS